MSIANNIPNDTINQLAAELVRSFTIKDKKLICAESCTGGMISAAITNIAGASTILEGGFVTYSNAQKTQSLGVDAGLIEQYGAVSAAVAEAMAIGALNHANMADIALSVTGVAGPGASDKKPAGLVFIGIAMRDGIHQASIYEYLFSNISRERVRQQTLLKALQLLIDKVDTSIK